MLRPDLHCTISHYDRLSHAIFIACAARVMEKWYVIQFHNIKLRVATIVVEFKKNMGPSIAVGLQGVSAYERLKNTKRHWG